MRVEADAAPRPAAPPLSRPERRSERSFTEVLDERLDPRPATAPPDPARPSTRAAPRAHAPVRAMAAPGAHAPVRAMLEGVVTAEKNIDALVAAAAHGKTFGPAELLALQASVFRYSQTVEVVSRVADRLVGAIKQTMGTQV